MIKMLGFKRVLILLVLISVNFAMAGALYFYIQPQHMAKDQQMRVLQSQISEKQSDIDRIQIAFEQLEVQQSVFDNLRARGFFGNQERRQAETALSDIQQKSGVISAIANIMPGRVRDDEEAQKADHKVLESSVNLRVEALDDTDIYRYLYLLQNYFPGHVAIEKVGLGRKGAINDAVLRGIAGGQSPPLTEVDILLIWRTMIPQSEIAGGQGG
ncbi:MAG: hypothetical protein ACT4OY_04550 [Alphaproteobacteria bacterium]